MPGGVWTHSLTDSDPPTRTFEGHGLYAGKLAISWTDWLFDSSVMSTGNGPLMQDLGEVSVVKSAMRTQLFRKFKKTLKCFCTDKNKNVKSAFFFKDTNVLNVRTTMNTKTESDQ